MGHFPLYIFENILMGHIPFLLYGTFSFIGHFHGTPSSYGYKAIKEHQGILNTMYQATRNQMSIQFMI